MMEIRKIMGNNYNKKRFCRHNEVIRVMVTMIFILLTVVLVSGTTSAASKKGAKRYKLSSSSKVLEPDDICKLTLKGKGIKAKKIKWSVGNKKILKITGKGKTVQLKAKNNGTITVTARYKGYKYRCTVKVVDDSEEINTENAKLNNDNVVVHHIEDYAVSYLGKPESYNYSFKFEVTGTNADIRKWEIQGDKSAKNCFYISDTGLLNMRFGYGITKNCETCKVVAYLSDGTTLTADVTGYDDVTEYVRGKVKDFINSNITDDMSEYDKMDAVAKYISTEYDYQLYQADWFKMFVVGGGDCMASRIAMMYMCRELGLKACACTDLDDHGQTVVKADGKIYMVITGFTGKKPRYYQITEMSEESFKKKCESARLDPAYFTD